MKWYQFLLCFPFVSSVGNDMSPHCCFPSISSSFSSFFASNDMFAMSVIITTCSFVIISSCSFFILCCIVNLGQSVTSHVWQLCFPPCAQNYWYRSPHFSNFSLFFLFRTFCSGITLLLNCTSICQETVLQLFVHHIFFHTCFFQLV